MELFGIIVLSLTAAFAALALKKHSPEIAAVLAISAGAAILFSILTKLSPIIGELQYFISSAGVDSAYAEVLIKTIGVCFLSQFTADACRDAGQSSLAVKVELAAKISIVMLSLPLLKNILQVIASLMGQ